MEIDNISTPRDFRDFVLDLIDHHSMTDRTIGTYLRALWAAMLQHKDNVVTYALLAQLIKSAYEIEPLLFDPAWLNVQQLGWTWDKNTESYIVKSFNKEARTWGISERNVDPFRILETTILAQISERHLLEDAPDSLTEKQSSYLKNNWSNPDPYPYLQTAIYVLYDETEEQTETSKMEVLDWAELAAILSIGQVYD